MMLQNLVVRAALIRLALPTTNRRGAQIIIELSVRPHFDSPPRLLTPSSHHGMRPPTDRSSATEC